MVGNDEKKLTPLPSTASCDNIAKLKRVDHFRAYSARKVLMKKQLQRFHRHLSGIPETDADAVVPVNKISVLLKKIKQRVLKFCCFQ